MLERTLNQEDTKDGKRKVRSADEPIVPLKIFQLHALVFVLVITIMLYFGKI